MFEPYPGAAPPPPVESAQLERPRSVRRAVILMYVGAALNAVAIVLYLTATSTLHTTLRNRFPNYTAQRIHTLEVVTIVALIVPQLIAVALWLWMAWANNRGRNWARIVSAVLFGLSTLYLVAALTRPRAGAGVIAVLVVWLVGLAATLLIYSRQSRPFYAQQR